MKNPPVPDAKPRKTRTPPHQLPKAVWLPAYAFADGIFTGEDHDALQFEQDKTRS
jgi:hypothetical protein